MVTGLSFLGLKKKGYQLNLREVLLDAISAGATVFWIVPPVPPHQP